MDRMPVSSSNIASVGYEQTTQTLEIEFLNGSIYQYLGVPLSIYSGLMSTRSYGSYLDQYVKKARYSYRKVR